MERGAQIPTNDRAPRSAQRHALEGGATDADKAGARPRPEANDLAPTRHSATEPAADRELLRQHVDGDPEAFGELFHRHKDRLWAVAIRTLGDPEEAADALQDAMISAFRRADSFRGDSAVTTWLHRIVINACLDRARRRAARPVSSADEKVLDSLGAAAGADPAAEIDVSMDVLAALRTLPHNQQAALVLIDMLGYSVAESAAILGVSEGTVKSRCARGRARLLPRLAHLHGRVVPPPRQGNRASTGHVLPEREGGEQRRWPVT